MNQRELRIGDRERDAAVTALGEHYVAGRLTKDEYDERSAVAWGARTNSDLAPLFVDLPALQLPERVTGTSARGGSTRGRSRWSGPPVLPILLLVVVVAGVSGMEIWPFLLLFGVYLWLRAWMGIAGMRRWVQRADRGTAVEPWRNGRPRR